MNDTDSHDETPPNVPLFDEFHNGDRGEPVRLEFSHCRLSVGVIHRLTLRKPDSEQLLVKWFEDAGLAMQERRHAESTGHTFIRQDSFRAF